MLVTKLKAKSPKLQQQHHEERDAAKMLSFSIAAIAFASYPLDSPAVAHPQATTLPTRRQSVRHARLKRKRSRLSEMGRSVSSFRM